MKFLCFARGITVAIALMTASHCLRAQGVDIRGVVSDSATGEKLPYTNVVLQGTSKGAASNLNGFYLITNVDPGIYELIASAVGYERRSHRVVLGRQSPVVVNFSLPAKAIEQEEVVVTETGKRELAEINTSVHVLDRDDIRAVPVTVVEDVFRSIQVLPGIVTTSDINSHFYVRGGGGDQNLILLDGIKIYNPFHAFGVLGIFDPDILNSTEVYTGAFPPGFGGRLSSVVSMMTRDGKSTTMGAKANINFLSGKIQVEGPIVENFQWIASGRKSLFPETLTNFFGQSVPIDFYDAFVKISRQTGSESRIGFQGFFAGDRLKALTTADPEYNWRTQALGLTASGLIQDRLFVRVMAFNNLFEADRLPGPASTVTPASTSINETNVRADATLYTGSQDLYFFGFEFNFPELKYELVNSFGTPRVLQNTLVETWVWIRYQTSIGPWKIDGGFHIDVGSMFQRSENPSLFQPRLSVSYALDATWRLKASYGRFSQNMITVNNEDDVISIFDAWIQVPENLESEQADHYVAGIDGNLTRSLSTSLQGYYKDYRSLVTYNRDKVDQTDPDYVSGTGSAYGLETLLRLGLSFVDFYGAYTLGWTTITSGDLTYAPRYDRRHSLNLLAVFHPVEKLDISARWEFGSGFPFTQTIGYYDRLSLEGVFEGTYVNETGNPYSILGSKNAARLPSYHRLDLAANYYFTIGALRGTAGISVINVYDHQNIFYFDRETGQQVNMLSFFPSASLTLEY